MVLGAEHENKPLPKEEPAKPLFVRIPESLWRDIKRIEALTGLSMQVVCLELLRPAIKQKLAELKNGGDLQSNSSRFDYPMLSC